MLILADGIFRRYAGENDNKVLEIAADAGGVLGELVAVVLTEELFFAEDLAVDKPEGTKKIEEQQPIGEDEELAEQDDKKSKVDGVARPGEHAGGDELIRVFLINADAEAFAEGDEGEEEKEQRGETEGDAKPGEGRAVEKDLTAEGGQVKGGSEDQIEIEEGEGGNDEVGPVNLAKVDGFNALAFELASAGDDHGGEEKDGERTEIILHVGIPIGWKAVNIIRE